jgi:hypothetical protein
MKEYNLNTDYKKITKYLVIIIFSLNLTSCFLGFSDDDDPIVVGENNTYKGIVVDLNGNPVAGKTVKLRSSFGEIQIAEFTTDENGHFEGQGVIYDTTLEVGIQNDGDVQTEFGGQVSTARNYFTNYTFDYTEYPSDTLVEFQPLIYTPISSIRIEIINNTGAEFSANYQSIIGVCIKNFEDGIEISSLCYEQNNDNLNFGSENGRIGIFAVRGSIIDVTISNDTNTITESFTINEANQEETIVFD